MLTNREKFLMQSARYYSGQRKTCPAGFHYGLGMDVAIELDTEARKLAVEILGEGNVPPLWRPANDFQDRRWRKAYTDRGLKVA